MALNSVSVLRTVCSLCFLLHIIVTGVLTSQEGDGVLRRDRRAAQIPRLPTFLFTSEKPTPSSSSSTSPYCEILIAPANGAVQCSWSFSQTTCTSTCDDSYVMENGETSITYTCDHGTQLWTPSTQFPSCHAVCDPPCQNNGICQAPGLCLCVHGYQGDHCEFEPQDFCENNLCQHGSSCVNDVQSRSYHCVCVNGFNGYYCEHTLCEQPRAPVNGALICEVSNNVKACHLQCLPNYQPSVQVVDSYQCQFDNDVWVPVLPDVDCLPIAQPTEWMAPTGYPTVGPNLPGQVMIDNNLFKVVTTPVLQWNQANRYCQDVYGDDGKAAHLAILATEEARIAVRDLLKSDSALTHPDNHGYWVGCSEQGSSGQYLWLNGSVVSVESWSDDQPNNNQCDAGQNQACCQLWEKPRFDPLFEIDDECCDREKPFICQIVNPVPSEPSPDPQPGGSCYTWGQSHYRTFDGRVYTFRGSCTYLLAGDCFDNSFKIHLRNQQQCYEPGHCQRSLSIFIGDLEFSLDGTDNGFRVTRGVTELIVPVSHSGLQFEKIGQFLVVRSGLGFTLRWDGREWVSVQVDAALSGKTCGLCGKYNEDYRDDMTDVNGNLVTSITDFATSYKMDAITNDQCQDESQHSLCHYDNQESVSQVQTAERLCRGLMNGEFAECNQIVSPESYYQACKEDVCGCQGNASSCQCDSYSAYASECNRHGVVIQWRNEKRCPFTCSRGMVYDQCGSSCPRTCKRTAYHCTDDYCIDGCHCPDGTALHDGVCINQAECPCFSGNQEYSPGSEIPNDDGCNTCTCDGGEWKCTTRQCGGTCSARGDPHYKTFDNHHYDFQGECSYVMVKNINARDANYSIVAENVHCGRRATCTKSVMVTIGDTYVKLKRDHLLVVNSKDLDKSDLPYKAPGVFIEQISDQFQKVTLENGIKLRWDGRTKIYIKVTSNFYNKTCGLCGTFDRNQENDFWTLEGDIERQPTAFGNKWAVDNDCVAQTAPPTNPCDVYTQKKQSAEKLCGTLKQPPFTDCHNLVNVDFFYDECLYDLCSSEGDATIEEIYCDALASYALACANKGQIMTWRDFVIGDNGPICPVQCENGKVYQECGSSCQTSCAVLAANLGCEEECNPGCSCPPGMVEDYHGNCIPVGDCVCKYNGKIYSPHDVTQQDCKVCTCTNGAWRCEERECEPTSVQCGENMEFVDCKDNCPQTCTNMHLKRACASSACEPGCQCVQGFVWDGDRCVNPVQCPCHHGGRSYGIGEKITIDCNTCYCNGQHWECETRQCPSVCAAWGESHHETFDGKLYEFQGQCSYILSQSAANNPHLEYSVVVENIPCGTSGVTCTKSILVTVKVEGREYTAHFIRGSLISVPYGSPFMVWEAGLFVFLHIGEGLTLQWDKGTFVSLKLDPMHRGKVKGLCGNANGDQMDDFTTPAGGPPAVTPLQFGDSWKVHEYCADSAYINDTCSLAPYRKAWAVRKCSILKSELFHRCHSEVPFEPYFDRCVFDSCACDFGGDCECLCTSIAAYTQKCNRNGIPVRWRSQELCPVQCEGCGHYEACTTACPKTCDNFYNYDRVLEQCDQTCVEGCECPLDEVYDESSGRCIPPSECYCIRFNGIKYYDGQIIPEYSDGCQSCFCSNHTIHCLGQPCVPYTTPFSPTSTPSLVTTAATTWMTTTMPVTTAPHTPSWMTTTGVMTTLPTTARPSTEQTTTEVRTTKEVTSGTTRVPVGTTQEVTSPEATTIMTAGTTTSPAGTTTPPVMTTSPCDSWTPWLNSHTPTLGTQMELETLDNLRNKYTFCEFPSAIKCRTVNTHWLPNQMDGNITCDLKSGLICHNMDQVSGLCSDYEVRFFCPCEVSTTQPPTSGTTREVTATPPGTTTPEIIMESSTQTESLTTPEKTSKTTVVTVTSTAPPTVPPTLCSPGFTDWFNIDSPDDGDDIESLVELRKYYGFCRFPEAIECRSADTLLTYAQTGESVTCDLQHGLKCLGADQDDLMCQDYMVRFDCGNCGATSQPPTSVTETTTSTTGTEGINETTVATEATTTAWPPSSPFAPTTPPVVTTSMPTEVTTPGTMAPQCNFHGWGPWMDVSYQAPDGDFETFPNLRKYFVFCEQPVDIQCRIVNSNVSYDQGGQRGVTCDVNHGLVCVNSEQVPHLCHNYEVRVYCICEAPTTPVMTTETVLTTTTITATRTVTKVKTTVPVTTQPVTPPVSEVTTGPMAENITTSLPTGQPVSTTLGGTFSTPAPVTPYLPVCEQDGWSEWMSLDTPTDMDNGGDFEDFASLRKGYQFCREDEIRNISCRVKDTGVDSSLSQQDVICTIYDGLVCENSRQAQGQLCLDYEISVYCLCAVTTTPSLTTKEQTTSTGISEPTATPTRPTTEEQPTTVSTTTSSGITKTMTTTPEGTVIIESSTPSGTVITKKKKVPTATLR